ncbi:hypothetical protein FQN54_007262 [Arachnomyces sp. PD_36]|nr:hypothetical protein FQN54_007262 [Arachnomyces sp. PD_36]
MRLTSLLVTTVALIVQQATAATWYFLTYYPPDGGQFINFSGDMVIPPLPAAAYYYLWPGLQPTDGSGVYQNVLDGRSGSWWFGSGWCCQNPSLPWGGGFNTYEGDTVSFSNTLVDSTWETTVTSPSGEAVTDSFDLTSKSFNQALFAIELTDVSWDFGPLAFRNVVIEATGTTTDWCSETPANYNDATVYSVTGISATVNGDTVTCTIEEIVLESPA